MQNVKGTYDYFGMEQTIRKNVQATLEEVFKLFLSSNQCPHEAWGHW